MKINQVADKIITSIKRNLEIIKDSGKREDFIVPMFWSEPGVGKTSQMREVVRTLGNYGWELFADRGATEQTRWVYQNLDFQTRDEADLAGNPWITEGKSVRIRPDYILDRPMVLYSLDEIAQSQPGNLNIASQMIYENRVGEHKFPNGSMFVGASNPAGSRTGTTALPGQLRSRMIHYNVEPDANVWADYAASLGYNPYLIAYTRYRARGHGRTLSGITSTIQFHHHYQPNKLTYPCARGWTLLQSTIRMNNDRLDGEEDFTGCVGDVATNDFIAFIEHNKRLPNIDDIIDDPTRAALPTELDGIFVTMQTLANCMATANMKSIVSYLKRIEQQDFAELCISDATRRDPGLLLIAPYADWSAHTANNLQQAA